jgi:peptidoglycan/LPS O-acetylase OafA/YrhL
MIGAFARAAADRDRGHYRPDIDGLRAIAVGVVVVYHAFPFHLPGGFVGVDVFFVISGYLISGIILGRLAENRFSFADFYARRIRRIFPALALVLAAVAIAGWFRLFADDYARVGRHIAAGAAFGANFLLWQENSYFDTAAGLKPLLHLWSLAIEEQFYLVWPALLVVAARWRRGPLAITLAIGTVSFLLSIWTVRIDRTPAFYAPWNRFWELLAGATLACIEYDAQLAAVKDRITRSALTANAFSIAGLVMIAAAVALIDSTRVFPGLWVMLPVLGTFLIIAAGPQAWFNRTVLSLPPVVWVGLISYPLYLWHWPLLSFARIAVVGYPSGVVRLLLVAISVVLAWATYRFVEWPIRFASRPRWAVPALSAVMVAVAAVGWSTHLAAGYIERPINRSDAAHLVEFYERMRVQTLREPYRHECDFMDWTTGVTRTTVDPSCTTPGANGTLFLWGDSFAQSLSLGLRDQLAPGTVLAQVATSACGAAIDNFDLTQHDRRCEKANLYAMEQIRRLRPQVTIVAQMAGHTSIDWARLARHTLDLGSQHVIVIGPFPMWYPSLPRIFAEHHLVDRVEYVSAGIDPNLFTLDRQLAEKVDGIPGVTYLSLLDALCRDKACLARVPGEGELDLMALDHGHVTPKGSEYIGRAILKPVLDRLRVQ